MIEAGAPSTGKSLACVTKCCARPTGVVMVAPPEVPRNAERAQGTSRAAFRSLLWRGQGQYRGRGPTPRASLQRGSVILREDCYNVVTKAPTLGNDSVVPDGKRERGVHARYALLGTRSAGGGRSPGDRLGAVPVGPPLALAARCGPGLTHERIPRPANGERWAG